MSPTEDCFSNGVGCEYPVSARFPGYESAYGPYTLALSGGSDRLNPRAGIWQRQTSTGDSREIVASKIKPGLNLVAFHNVMFDGSSWAETFEARAGVISANPNPVDLYVAGTVAGEFPVTVRSSLALPGLEVEAYGLGAPVKQTLPQLQDDPNDPGSSSYQFPITVENAALIDVATAAAAGDLDL
jgi:hypothetical protein